MMEPSKPNPEKPAKKGRKKQPQIKVGDANVNDLLATIDEARRKEIEQEEKRSRMAKEIARFRWGIAQHVHRLQDGKTKMDFNSRPFQRDILQDESTDIIIYGAAQFGKSEILICHAVTCAGLCGLKVLWVISKADKRNKFVSDRIDPCFGTIPAYKKMLEQAHSRAAKSDSTGLKHFGDGAINFVYATAYREFTTYAVDVGIIDEHQECDQQNLKKIDDRMSGSDWGFLMRVGHPSVDGTEENANLDWLYQNSDKRIWKVPCPTCKKTVELDWHRHVIHEVKNKSGGIVSVKPRDQEWKPNSPLDMRPICDECFRPMDRLSSKGFWEAQSPDVPRHGYNLGNLYNPSPTCRLSRLYERYLNARHNPSDMAEFFNKVLGKPFSLVAEKINESMLTMCSTGDGGVVPYRFVPAGSMDWRILDQEVAA